MTASAERDRLSQVTALDPLGSGKVGNGARHPPDAVPGACRKCEAVTRSFEQLFTGQRQCAMRPQPNAIEPPIETPGALELALGRCQHSHSHRQRIHADGGYR